MEPVDTDISPAQYPDVQDADAAQPLEPTRYEGTIEERIFSKDWKARASAAEDLKTKVSSREDVDWNAVGSVLASATADSNATVLDTALDVAHDFIDAAPSGVVASHWSQIVGNVAEKAFGGRPSAQSRGKKVVLKVMEVSNLSGCVSLLIPKLVDRRPKIPPMCLDIFVEGMIMFGIGEFPVKAIVKDLLGVFNGSNSVARDSAMKLLLEIHRWVGLPPIQSLLDSLRSAQKAEFEKLLADRPVDGSAATPTVRTRSAREAVQSGSAPIREQAIDSRQFCEEIDLSKALKPTDFADQILSEKWSDQQAALLLLLKVMGPTPVLKYSGTIHDIVGLCHGFLKQGHIQVQASSLRVLSIFVESLRDKVTVDLRPVISTIIGRSKEKKLVVDLLDLIKRLVRWGCSFDVMATEMVDLLKGKNPPHAKLWGIELFECVVQEAAACSCDSMQCMYEALLLCCEDSDAKVRELSVRALREIRKVVKTGDKRAESVKTAFRTLETSSPKLFNKIVGGATDMSAVAPPKASAEPLEKKPEPAKILSTARSIAPKSDSPTAVSSSLSLLPKSKISAQLAAKKASSSSAEDETVEEGVMGFEQAVEVLQAFISDKWDSVVAKLGSAKWQDKLEAVMDIQNLFQDGQKESSGMLLSATVVFLSKQTSGFKISNIMVLKGVIDLACRISTAVIADKYSKSAAWELLQNFTEKISDKKVGPSVEGMLSVLCDLCGGSIVIKRGVTLVEASKTPAVHQSFLQWLKQRIEAVGLHQFPVPVVAPFCLKEMENKMASVRSSAVEALGAVYSKCGPRLLSVIKLDDLPPQTRQVIENEFSRVGYDTSAAQGANGDAQADIFPRKDLMGLLDKSILKELSFTEGKTSWQNRKKALESIIAACEGSGHYLEFNKPTAELIKAVKQRIGDTQSNLKPIAVSALGHLVASFATDSGQKVLRSISAGMLSGLSENKKPMRESTIASLQYAVTKGSSDTDVDLFMAITPAISEAFGHVLGRQELLEWLFSHREHFVGDQSELVPSLLSALLDKLAPVRQLSEQLLSFFISSAVVPKAAVEKVTRDFAPANKRAVQAVLDRLNALPINKAGAAAPSGAQSGPGAQLASREDLVSASEALVHAANPTPSAVEDRSGDCHQFTPPTFLDFPTFEAASRQLTWPSPPQEPSYHDLMRLKIAWADHLSRDLAEALFPTINRFDLFNQDAMLPAIRALHEIVPSSRLSQHLRFVLAWSSYCLYVRETNSGMHELLALLEKLLAEVARQDGAALDDETLRFLIPHLIDAVGGRGEKYGARLGGIFDLLFNAIPARLTVRVLLWGLAINNNNKRGKVFCVEYMSRVVAASGSSCLSPEAMRQIGELFDSCHYDSLLSKPVLFLLAIIREQMNVSVDELKNCLGALSVGALNTLDTAVGSGLEPRDDVTASEDLSPSDGRLLVPILRTFVASTSSEGNVRLAALSHLKLLVSALSGAAACAETDGLTLTLVCQCVVKACPHPSNIDFPLLAVSLSCLHQLCKAAPLLDAQVKFVVETVLIASDAVVQCDNWDMLGTVMLTNLLRALHIVLVDSTARSSYLSLLLAMFEISACASGRRLCAATCQTVCRLADRLQGQHASLQQAESPERAAELLLVLHRSSSSAPITSPAALHVLRKAVVFIADTFGKDFVSAKIAQLGIPGEALVSVVFDRLAEVHGQKESTHNRIVALIDQITSSASKSEPVFELFQIKQHCKASVDMDSYLSKLSAPFRSFVLDTWQSLEKQPGAAEGSESRSALGENDNASMHKRGPEVATGAEVGATEAMRILEGLKARPNHFTRVTKNPETAALDSPSPRSSSASRGAASPFTRRTDKIRDSLCNLSASLDLPITLRENRQNSAQSDLQERLQRLKSNMEL